MIRRLSFFFLTNLLVVVTIGILTSVLGLHSSAGAGLGPLMAFCFVYGMVGAFISLALSRISAKWMMGVKLVDERAGGEAGWLRQKVYELARAANLPAMPEVGIYDSSEVNAFATGPTKSRSLVAVSSGLLSRMDQNDVEGVLAHEIAHIKNGDMVTMTLLQGVINAFTLFVARVVAYLISQNVREDMRSTVYFTVQIILDIILGILGMLVVCWFSRQREFRADYGGAQLAGRNKMIGALQSLGRTIGRADSEGAPALATLKISGGPARFFRTHPPLEERIARLEQYSS